MVERYFSSIGANKAKNTVKLLVFHCLLNSYKILTALKEDSR